LAAKVSAGLPAQVEWRNRAPDRIQMLTESYLVGRADRWAILGARHGVAFSYPLVDRRVIDFTLSLPLERFLDGGFSRQPFRNAMAGILPESIRWRESKFSPFLDMPPNLAAAAPRLLTRLDKLRNNSAATDIVDMDAIGEALSAAAAHAPDRGRAVPPLLQGPMPQWFKMGMHAMRALNLAEHVARLS
jgi:asparagine synthase (glutamine-hydrolysing)